MYSNKFVGTQCDSLNLTFCKRSNNMALTPVLSKSRFSSSERNSGTFKSQILRNSNVSDIITSVLEHEFLEDIKFLSLN